MSKTILVLAANPKNSKPHRLDQEIREIDSGLQRAQNRDEFIFKQRWAVRQEDVRRAMLDYKPSIVHFCGQGAGEEGIAFEDENGQAKLVNANALAGFFELFAHEVECVILNACYSEVQAEAISKHIPHVIGMSKAIDDAAAIDFSVAFYDALGAGKSVEFAHKLACNAIQWSDMSQALIPVLKSRSPTGPLTPPANTKVANPDGLTELEISILESMQPTGEQVTVYDVMQFADADKATAQYCLTTLNDQHFIKRTPRVMPMDMREPISYSLDDRGIKYLAHNGLARELTGANEPLISESGQNFPSVFMHGTLGECFHEIETTKRHVDHLRIYANATTNIQPLFSNSRISVERCDILIRELRRDEIDNEIDNDFTSHIEHMIKQWQELKRKGRIKKLFFARHNAVPTEWQIIFDDKFIICGLNVPERKDWLGLDIYEPILIDDRSIETKLLIGKYIERFDRFFNIRTTPTETVHRANASETAVLEAEPIKGPELMSRSECDLELFDFPYSEGEEFYTALARSYRNAKHSIYLSGRGYSSVQSDQLSLSRGDVIDATESALLNGVKIVRFQTSRDVSEVWAQKYADLIDRFPNTLKVLADFSDPSLVNTGIVDPDGENPIIQLMFESQRYSHDKEYYPAVTAVFLRHRKDLAFSLQKMFVDRMKGLSAISPDEMRNLGSHYLYFAYGSNLSTRQMRDRCPSAITVGSGVLYGWKLSFSVYAPHLGSAAAGIQKEEGGTISGVVYKLSYRDKLRLDDMEAGGYRPENVSINMESSNCEAFTYIPTNPMDPNQSIAKPNRAYLNRMIEGAKEHCLTGLLEYLEGVLVSTET